MNTKFVPLLHNMNELSTSNNFLSDTAMMITICFRSVDAKFTRNGHSIIESISVLATISFSIFIPIACNANMLSMSAQFFLPHAVSNNGLVMIFCVKVQNQSINMDFEKKKIWILSTMLWLCLSCACIC